MRRHLLATAVLVPAAAAATALPASAATPAQWHAVPDSRGTISAASVSNATMPSAAPMRQLRSSTQSCSGTLITTVPAMVGTKLAGQLNVYYKTANGGTVIACLHHAGVTKGLRLPTTVALVGAKSAKAKPAIAVTAYGNFISYAGPAALGGMNGTCIQAAGAMRYQGKVVTVATKALCDK